MKRNGHGRGVAWLLAPLGLLPSPPADSSTLHVPSQYASIQAGVDASVAGDTVVVAPGDYMDYVTRSVVGLGNVTAMAFLKDGIILKGAGGSAMTRLVHSAAPGPVATTLMAHGHVSEQTVVEGFSFVSEIPQRGGIWGHQSKKLTVRQCVFQGLHYQGINGFLSDFEVADSRFEDCVGDGGAVLQEEGLCLLTRCTFLRCRDSAVNLNGFAGGPVEIRECVFQDCVRESPGGGGGGAVHISGYPQGATIDRCIFVHNTTNNSGGAIQMGSGIVSNCVFWGNQAAVFGGSLSVANSVTQIVGNTFLGSTLLNPFEGGGAAASFSGGTTQFTNNIIASTDGAPAVRVWASGVVATSCNVFWDNPDGIGVNYTPGPTDRIADPMFCDPIIGDLELFEHSPCLPENSLGCGLIGALGEGCGTVSVDQSSWGRLKAAYRKAGGE